MKRRLLNVLAAISLLLFVATVAVWVRSYWVGDQFDLFYDVESTPKEIFESHGFSTYRISSVRNYRGRIALAIGGEPGGWYYGPEHRGWYRQTVHKPSPWFGFKAQSPFFLALPHALLVTFFGVGPITWAWKRGRTSRPLAIGACPACGYDLRASPGRCPECGTKTRALAEKGIAASGQTP